MRHKVRTTERHIDELRRMRERIAEMEKSEADCRRIEAELRNSKELLEKTFESQPDAIFVLDTGVPPKIVDCNPAAASMFGYARQELLGRTTQFLHVSEAKLEQFQEQLYPIINQRGAFHFADFQMRRKDAEIFPTEHCVVPLKDEEGARIGWVSVVRDISNRRAHEKALRESEERYRTLVETIPHGIQEIDPTGTITFANSAYEKIFGEAEGETIGKSVLGLQISDAARAELRDYLAKLVTEQPAPTPYMAKNLTRDGRIIDVQVDWNYRRHMQGRVTGFISIVTDTTDRKRAEEALRQAHTELERRVSERTAELKMINEKLKQEIAERKHAENALRESEGRYRNIFENAVEGLFQATPEGRYLNVNPAWANMCGFGSPEEMIREVTDIASQLYVKPEDRTRIKRLYEEPGFVKGFETQFRRKDGRLIWIAITARSVRDSNGAILYYEGVIEDISERKRAQEELEQTTRALDERVRELRCLMSISKLIERQDLSIAERMRSVVELIPSAYQYPEMTCARVVIDRQQFKTANFRKSRWGQRAEVFAYGKSAGSLEVCYLSEVPEADEGPFLTEERDLIRMIAENLGRMIERKQAEEERQAYQQHLQSLASDLLFTEERERRRFAIDLHDSIGQVLAMTKLKLDMLQSQVASTKLTRELDEARQFVGQAIQQARSLTFELSPPVLYEVGLEAALEDLVERVEERHGLWINFTDDRRPKPLNEDLRIYLFRAVRELLVNIVKHANARSAKVAVGRRDDQIRIEVADDGVGLKAADLNSHVSRGGKFGLFSIRERLQHLGGRFEIVSEPGGGTKLVLLAPVKSARIPES